MSYVKAANSEALVFNQDNFSFHQVIQLSEGYSWFFYLIRPFFVHKGVTGAVAILL